MSPVKHSPECLHLLVDHFCWALTANERIGATEPIPEVVYLMDLLADECCGTLHFADNPMQQAGSDHLVAAKLHCNVLKEGIAVGRCYRLGGLHQLVEFVRAQSQSQLVHWGHGELHTENGGMRQPEFGFNV